MATRDKDKDSDKEQAEEPKSKGKAKKANEPELSPEGVPYQSGSAPAE